MKKLFYLHRRENGRFYVRFVDELTGSLSKAVSTGETERALAERKAMQMLNVKPSVLTPVEQIMSVLQNNELEPDDIKSICNFLKDTKQIASVTFNDTPNKQRFYDFCIDFWTYDSSPYVREKLLYKQNIHRTYCKRNVGFIQKHFKFFENLLVSEINKQKIKEFQLFLMSQALSAETINQVTRIATTPLKWAFNNGLTQNDCFTGLRFVSVVHKPRKILDRETAAKIFSVRWSSDYSKLANLVAMCTGMRAGEIQALRRCDIGEDRLYVRHNYVSKNNEGLKSCKNGEEREIPISSELRMLLLKQVFQNPYGEGEKAFVFWGLVPGQPMDAKPWLTSLRRALKKIDYPKPKEICFHSWRHFYASQMIDYTPENKLQRATGHKTLSMLQHYANHEKAEDLELIAKNELMLFNDIVKAM